MLTYEQNVKAILESVFAGYKDELIENACKMICTLNDSEKVNKIRFLLDLWNDPEIENLDDDVSRFIKNKLNELGVKDNEIYK